VLILILENFDVAGDERMAVDVWEKFNLLSFAAYLDYDDHMAVH